jgi:hypothetical protein
MRVMGDRKISFSSRRSLLESNEYLDVYMRIVSLIHACDVCGEHFPRFFVLNRTVFFPLLFLIIDRGRSCNSRYCYRSSFH